MDERLTGLVQPLPPSGDLVPSHHELAEQVAAILSWASESSNLPVIHLCGNESESKRAIASAACASLGLGLGVLPASTLPTAPTDLEELVRLWEREWVLGESALLVDCDDIDSNDMVRQGAVTRLIDGTTGPIFLASRDRRSVPVQRQILTYDVDKPTSDEQRTLWRSALGPLAASVNGQVDGVVSHFNLNGPTIQTICTRLMGSALLDDRLPEGRTVDLEGRLWDTCRTQVRVSMADLARRIDPRARWEDLVLPDTRMDTLRDMASQVRQRTKVYETWGFAARVSRGLGITALFVGPSGTGKTMAAEVLAIELNLDLYAIDLSSVVSKYIGETEKNLKKVFDAAEEGGAVLLFDEADALFGKRTEVKDSHDRYANVEVSYLLQRMEEYRGLAILTTNMKEALDTAFLRRIRFIVEFPFPDAVHRAEIWSKTFPQQTPTHDLDIEKLAQLNIPGGVIRNVAMNAAFLAADEDQPVGMPHILRAARSEYGKLQKPLSELESKGLS